MEATHGWRSDATAEVAEGLRANPELLLETLDRINHIAAGMSLDEVIQEAGREVAASWFGQDPVPARKETVDWLQLGEHFVLEVLARGTWLGR
jgi:hypothetical protein